MVDCFEVDREAGKLSWKGGVKIIPQGAPCLLSTFIFDGADEHEATDHDPNDYWAGLSLFPFPLPLITLPLLLAPSSFVLTIPLCRRGSGVSLPSLPVLLNSPPHRRIYRQERLGRGLPAPSVRSLGRSFEAARALENPDEWRVGERG
jgi:hypothetical protein